MKSPTWLILLVLSCKPEAANTRPEAIILQPGNGDTLSLAEPITIAGTVSDNEDAPTDLLAVWSSDVDGMLFDGAPDGSGTTKFDTQELSVGQHVLTLTVTDSVGDDSFASVLVVVTPAAQAPTIEISAPASDDFGRDDEAMTLEATVTDPDDALEELLVTITSDQDGDLCEATPDVDGLVSCDEFLSTGKHLLTFTVIDPSALTTSASVTVTIEDAATLDDDDDGYTEDEGDCDDADATVNPDALELENEADDDCDLIIDEGTNAFDDDEDGYSENDGDCDDANKLLSPATTELANGLDDNCDGTADEGTSRYDNDGDCYCADSICSSSSNPNCGSVEPDDCNDNADDEHPGATETVGDGFDSDCDTFEQCYADTDGDKHGSTTTVNSADLDCGDAGEAALPDDCNDSAGTVYPGATEIVADGVDQDCSTGDSCYTDGDGDTYGTAVAVVSTDLDCSDAGEATTSNDCDDTAGGINPGATEGVGDNIDQNCDAKETCKIDVDKDSYAASTGTVVSATDTVCTTADGEALATAGVDCNDGNAAIKPGATEITGDSVDQNCDSKETCYVDFDKDSYRTSATVLSTNAVCATADGEANSTAGIDCVDTNATINPGATEIVGDGIDQTCDAKETCYVDFDKDGYRTTATVVSPDASCLAASSEALATAAIDCADTNAAIKPGATEITGNDIDENCDGKEVCYVDVDNDDFGTATVLSTDANCNGVNEGHKTSDCNDGDPTTYLGAPQICSMVDHNCDGTLDGDLDKDGELSNKCGGYDCVDTNATITTATCTRASCKAARTAGYTSDGGYYIDPDGAGGAAPYPVTCEMDEDGGGWERCFTFTNTSAIDITGNSWLDKCVDTAMMTNHIGTEVRVDLHDTLGATVYRGVGVRPSSWTYDNLTSNIDPNNQFHSQYHVATSANGRIVPLDNGDNLMITGRFSSNGGCGGSFGNGYGILVYPPAPNYYSNPQIFVGGYYGGLNGSPRSFTGWSPSTEITYQPGGYNSCSSSPGFLGTFDFYVR